MGRVRFGVFCVLLLACDDGGDVARDAAPRHDASRDAGPSEDASRDAAPSEDAARDSASSDDASVAEDASEAGTETRPLRVVAFTRTAAFRHSTIEPALRTLNGITSKHSATLRNTEDPAELIALLPETEVVVFLMTTGDVLDDTQQTAFEAFIRAGGGFLGVHSASDTEYQWPFYGTLIGAWFDSHPGVQPATLKHEATGSAVVNALPARWERADEWYNFKTNPRGQVDVLLTLDETTYEGGTMGADHPIVWSRQGGAIGKGRSFYTALGHTSESWEEEIFIRHIEAGLLWAANR
jgi:type 1 glutamine amidotransferase